MAATIASTALLRCFFGCHLEALKALILAIIFRANSQKFSLIIDDCKKVAAVVIYHYESRGQIRQKEMTLSIKLYVAFKYSIT